MDEFSHSSIHRYSARKAPLSRLLSRDMPTAMIPPWAAEATILIVTP